MCCSLAPLKQRENFKQLQLTQKERHLVFLFDLIKWVKMRNVTLNRRPLFLTHKEAGNGGKTQVPNPISSHQSCEWQKEKEHVYVTDTI